MNSLKNLPIELWKPERFVLNLILVIMAIDLLSIALGDVSIDWAGYGSIVFAASLFFSAGQFYRVSGRSERIGTALICTSLIMLFSTFIVLFSYLLLPAAITPIDQSLVWVDSLYGYDWPGFVAWSTDYPWFIAATRIAYLAIMPQMALVVIVLGLTGRLRDLHVMLVLVAITSVFTVCFWGLVPSVGPSALYSLPEQVLRAVNPVVDPSYGDVLLEILANGPAYVSPSETKGLIAFPSYHAIAAFCAFYAARNVRWLMPVYLVLVVLVVPATPLHGGHHLIDVIAGFAVFAVGVVISERLVRGMYAQAGQRATVPEARQAA